MLAGSAGRVFAPTLAGMAERSGETGVGMGTHVDDVVRVIDDNDLHDVVLVGHSYGGIPVAAAAHLRPDRIHCLVYLDALVPQDGQSCADVLGPEFAEQARTASELAGTPETIPWLFRIEDILGTGPEADRVASRMTPHPTGTLFEPVRTAGGDRLRKVYVFCTRAAKLGMTVPFAQNARSSPDWGVLRIAGSARRAPCLSGCRGGAAGAVRRR